jgi:hypothetical protein
MSLRATGGGGDAGVPESASASPFLKALTSVTVVLASGVNAVIIELSHVNATGVGAGAEAEADAAAAPSSPPLHADSNAPAAQLATSGTSAAI